MLLLGLTGSIATGKSTVSAILSAPPYSLPIIDADKIARQVVEPGTAAYRAIVSHFASTTPDLLTSPAPGSTNTQSQPPINRPALGRRVFGAENEKDRRVLNGIVHPAVRREMYKQILSAYVRGHWAVVLDVPLLFESGWEPLCGSILVVGVRDPRVQMERLMARDAHLSYEDAENRVASQWDVRDKAARCLACGSKRGLVVWNDGDRNELEQQLARMMESVKAASPQWWTWALLVCPPLALASAAWNFAIGWWAKRCWERSERQVKAKL